MLLDERRRFPNALNESRPWLGGQRGPFKVFEYDTVDAFLYDLTVLSFTDPFPVRGLLFRGSGDLDWGLVPAALRPPWRRSDEEEQRRLEFLRLARFALAADRVGHKLPGLLDAFQVSDRCHEAWECGTPFPLELLPVAALAQHHGVPTRLLDWTRDRLAAAFFAGDAAERRYTEHPAAKLAVWILSPSVVHGAPAHTGVHRESPFRVAGERSDLWKVTIPFAGNEHLRAQSGVFLMRRAEGSENPAWWVGSEDYPADLAQSVLDHEADERSPIAAAVMTLPAEYGGGLKARLAEHYGVDRVKLFPTLDGAAGLVNRDAFEAGVGVGGIETSLSVERWRRVSSEAQRRGVRTSELLGALCDLLPEPLGGRPWEPTGWDLRTPVVDALDSAMTESPRTPPRNLLPLAKGAPSGDEQ